MLSNNVGRDDHLLSPGWAYKYAAYSSQAWWWTGGVNDTFLPSSIPQFWPLAHCRAPGQDHMSRFASFSLISQLSNDVLEVAQVHLGDFG